MPLRKGHKYPDTYRKSRIEKLQAKHPGLRPLVEDLLHRRCAFQEISQAVKRRFGVALPTSSIQRFWMRVIKRQEEKEAEAYRQARAQTKALLAEMKADPDLTATQIAEVMLANQIVKDRLKLGEADIMALYREQREREKLDLQRRAFEMREKEAKRLLEAERKKARSERKLREDPDALRRKIDEIYGISEQPPVPEHRV